VRTSPVTQVDVEELLFRLGEQLDATTEEYEKISEERAVAESDFKERFWRAMVTTVDHPRYKTASVKEAWASFAAKEESRRFKLLEAREKATQQKLITLRARMDSLRTIAANVRAMGG